MPVVAESDRIDLLKSWGISAPILHLSSGESIHDLFSVSCLGPPWRVYHQAEVPDGPIFAPLWEFADCVTGVWKNQNQLQFILFDVEAPDEFEILASTEQGFLAYLLLLQYENADNDIELSDLSEPAQPIGFRFLDRLVEEYAKANIENHDEWEDFCEGFVDEVDSLAS